MADRTVNVRLNLDVSGTSRGAAQAERDYRRMARSAEQAAAQAQTAARTAATAAGGTFSSVSRQTAGALQGVERAAASSSQAITRTSTTMSRATAEAATGTARLSLASRLALGEAAQASQTAAARSAAAARSISTSASLASSGARRASEAAGAAAERAAARSAAAGTGALSRIGARAGAMATSVASASARSERSLKVVRNGSLLLVAAFGAAVYAASKFETAMSGVKAATQAGASELAKLRQAAIDAGSSTQFSATQAAGAEMELAKAGVSTADILGGALKGTLNLASAGQMDVADSAVVAAKAMNSFGLSGKDMAHIADVIAAAAGKSATDVHGMSLAFAQSSLLAHQTGLSLEQTAGSLALFAQNGLVGSDAGTSLKTMLMRLTPQSQQAADMMNKLGFSAYDAQGKFVGLPEVAARMQKAFANLTPEARNAAMGVIFGSDAIRAATIVSQSGAAGINTWTKAANDQGYAARYAATQTDNLSGDLHKLKSALETALIQSGSAANGVLRDMVKWVGSVVRAYNDLPPELQSTVTLLGGVTGAVGLVGAGMLMMLPRIMTVRRELITLGVTAEATKTKMMLLGKVGLITAGIAAVSWGVEELVKKMDPAPANVSKLTSSLIDLARGGKAGGEAARVLGDNLSGFGDAVARVAHPSVNERLTDISWTVTHFGGDIHQLTEARDKLSSVDQALATMVSSGNAKDASDLFAKLAKTANENGTSTEKLRTLLPQYDDALSATAAQTKLAAGGQQKLGDATATTTGELKDQRTEVEKLQAALDALNGKNIDAATSAISYQGSLGDLKKAVKDNGHSLDITSEKGRAVKSAFLDAAKAAQAHAQAVADQSNSVAAGDAVLAQDVDQLKAVMHAAHFTDDQIRTLIGSYAQLPPSKTTKVTDPGAQQTIKDLETIKGKVANVPAGKTITVKAPTADAVKALRDLGFKVVSVPGKKVKITVPTSDAFNSTAAIQGAINSVHGKQVKITTIYDSHYNPATGSPFGVKANSYGGVISRYAGGGTVPGYAPRQDVVPALLSPGEGVLVPEAVRALGGAKAIAAINMYGRYGTARFADGGTVGGGFTYSPAAPSSTFGAGSGMDRYTAAVQRLKDAWDKLGAALANQRTQVGQLKTAEAKAAQVRKDGNRKISQAEDNLNRVRHGRHTHAQLIAAERRLSDARYNTAKANKAASAAVNKERADKKAADNAVSSAKGGVLAADKALGLRGGSKAPTGFDLKGYQLQLAEARKANDVWEANLASIGKRAGGDVEETLRGMGEEGQALVAALAHATGAQFDDIVKNLKALAPTAKATLSDFTSQLNKATGSSKAFQQNLLKLAQMGYGDLAAQLAAQGDETAAAVAAAAVASPSSAASANTAAAANAGLMSGEDVANAIRVIGALKGRTGVDFAGLVTSTGLDVSTLLTLLPRIRGQIDALPAVNKQALLAQWSQLGLPAPSASSGSAGMSGGPLAVDPRRIPHMARGAILSGRDPVVIAGEARRRESYIPLDGSARSQALLGATAGLMGYQLVPAARFAGPGGGGSGGASHVDQSRTVVLNGAKQSSAEQAADILRHMTVLA